MYCLNRIYIYICTNETNKQQEIMTLTDNQIERIYQGEDLMITDKRNGKEVKLSRKGHEIDLLTWDNDLQMWWSIGENVNKPLGINVLAESMSFWSIKK